MFKKCQLKNKRQIQIFLKHNYAFYRIQMETHYNYILNYLNKYKNDKKRTLNFIKRNK